MMGTGVLATEDTFGRFFNAMFEAQECATEPGAMIRKTVGKIDALRRINLEDARDRVVRICKRQAELDLLDRTEELASRWQRAQALRDYAMALDSSMAKDLTTELDERPTRVAWILRAADWLDPLVNEVWPEVDEVPQSPV